MKRDTGLLAMGLCIGLLLALLTTKRSATAPAAFNLSSKVAAVAKSPALPLFQLNLGPVRMGEVAENGAVSQDPLRSEPHAPGVLIDFRYQQPITLGN